MTKRLGAVYVLSRVGWDKFDPVFSTTTWPDGTEVKICAGRGVGRFSASSPFAYVETTDGKFLGMVLKNSLVSKKEWAKSLKNQVSG